MFEMIILLFNSVIYDVKYSFSDIVFEYNTINRLFNIGHHLTDDIKGLSLIFRIKIKYV